MYPTKTSPPDVVGENSNVYGKEPVPRSTGKGSIFIQPSLENEENNNYITRPQVDEILTSKLSEFEKNIIQALSKPKNSTGVTGKENPNILPVDSDDLVICQTTRMGCRKTTKAHNYTQFLKPKRRVK